jgi:hypothetical protein
MGAARNGHAHAIKLLIAAGADVDAKGAEGYGPLAPPSTGTDILTRARVADQADEVTDNVKTGIDHVDKGANQCG